MLISHNKGAIFLDDGAAIFLKDGHIVYVTHPKEVGEKAVRQILKRTRGNFRFHPDAFPPEETLNILPMSFMLEVAKNKDEIKEGRRKNNHQSSGKRKQLVVLPNLAVAQTYMNSLGLQEGRNFTAREKYLSTYEVKGIVFESDFLVIISLNSTLSMLPKDLLGMVHVLDDQDELAEIDIEELLCIG